MFKSGFGVSLMLIWFVGSVLAAIMNLSSDIGDGGSSASGLQNFYESATDAKVVKIDTPASGDSTNPISTTLSYAHMAADAVIFLARAATWDFPFMEGWGQTIRWAFFGISAIYIVSAMVEITAPLTFLINSLANAGASVLNAFLGRR